jgi:hypothetical protein
MTNRPVAPPGAPCWVDLWTSDIEGIPACPVRSLAARSAGPARLVRLIAPAHYRSPLGVIAAG